MLAYNCQDGCKYVCYNWYITKTQRSMHMKQNKFDLVMDYIDASILHDVETIKKGIYSLIGYNSLTFGNCFSVLTGQTLFHYINGRKMYFAAQSLRNDIDRSIADIALEYGYSEQSAFSRAFKLYCQVTPLEVRKGKGVFVVKTIACSFVNKGWHQQSYFIVIMQCAHTYTREIGKFFN